VKPLIRYHLGYDPSVQAKEPSRMDLKIITWDGSRLPNELRDLPPGRYAIAAIDEPTSLTEEEDAGLRAALDALDAGRGIPLADVVHEIRGRDRSK
jgi:hypothetical protein